MISTIIEVVPEGYVAFDSGWSYIYVNAGAERMLGVKREQLLGKSIWEVYPEFETWVHESRLHHAMEVEHSQSFEDFSPLLNKWLKVQIYHHREGHVISFIDVTSRKEAEINLERSREGFRFLTEALPQIVYIIRADGSVQYSNKCWYRYIGLSPDEKIKPEDWLRVIHSEDLDRVHDCWRYAIERQEEFECEYRLRRADGVYHWHLCRAVPAWDTEGRISAWFGTATDIESQKRNEEALQRSNRRVTSILESITDGFVSLDHDWHYTYVNKEAERVLGKAREELLGRVIWEVFPGIENTPSAEYYRQVMKTHEPIAFETLSVILQAWFESRVYPLEDGLLIYFHNINDRKELEKRKDDFISMASHELKTPIASIKAFNQILQRLFARNGQPEAMVYLTKMEVQINRLTRLIEQLLDISRIQKGRLDFAMEPFDFDALITEVVENLQQTSNKHRIAVYGSAGCSLVGDRDRLGQVLINLVTNGIKYSPGADVVELTVRRVEDNVVVAVQDYGVGIPTEHQSRVFERFYRVYSEKDRTFPGLGIGLYISYEIIKRHSGHMWIESEVGRGSTFSFSLPLEQPAEI
jgi:PAS domain S-box-containing protein